MVWLMSFHIISASAQNLITSTLDHCSNLLCEGHLQLPLSSSHSALCCLISLPNKRIRVIMVIQFQSSLRMKSMFPKSKRTQWDSALFPSSPLPVWPALWPYCVCGSLNTSHSSMSILFQTCLLCFISFLFSGTIFPYSFLNSPAILSFETVNPFINYLGSFPWCP